MSTLIEELCGVLEENADCVDRLVELCGRKKDAVIQNDVDSLREILARENEVIGRSQRMEKRREALFSDIALVLNRPKDGLTLGGLCDSVKGQPESVRLENIHEKLKGSMEALRAINDENRVLIQSALDYVDFSVNVLRTTFVDESQDYSESGKSIDISN